MDRCQRNHGDRGDVDDILIERGTIRNVDELKGMWLQIHHHHASVMPSFAPYVDDETSWSVRREFYAQLLSRDTSVLLLARHLGDLVAYTVGHVEVAAGTWTADTWKSDRLIGEIDSLGVSPHFRNAGLGSNLLHQLVQELEKAGARDLVIGVLAGNEAALRLYERLGFRPTYSYLSRFKSRGEG